MRPAEFLADLSSRGISLVVYGDKLRCRGKQSALTPDILATLRHYKQEVLAYLSCQTELANLLSWVVTWPFLFRLT